MVAVIPMRILGFTLLILIRNLIEGYPACYADPEPYKALSTLRMLMIRIVMDPKRLNPR